MSSDGDLVVATVRRAGAGCAVAFDGRILVEVVRHRTPGATPEDELIARYRASELVVEDTHPQPGPNASTPSSLTDSDTPPAS